MRTACCGRKYCKSRSPAKPPTPEPKRFAKYSVPILLEFWMYRIPMAMEAKKNGTKKISTNARSRNQCPLRVKRRKESNCRASAWEIRYAPRMLIDVAIKTNGTSLAELRKKGVLALAKRAPLAPNPNSAVLMIHWAKKFHCIIDRMRISTI